MYILNSHVYTTGHRNLYQFFENFCSLCFELQQLGVISKTKFIGFYHYKTFFFSK